MTEAEAIRCFESLGLVVEGPMTSFHPNGYVLIDPLRPDGIVGEACSLTTYIWPEGQEWVWESKAVVPGPGPRHRFRSLSELVVVVRAAYESCRKADTG